MVADVVTHPDLFDALVDAMTDSDAVVRMRAADAAEKPAFGIQAVLDLTADDETLRSRVMPIVEGVGGDGKPR